ncbi:MAG: hypothetical protein ABIP85_00500, partial [Chthoniobacteraceae bacterium]
RHSKSFCAPQHRGHSPSISDICAPASEPQQNSVNRRSGGRLRCNRIKRFINKFKPFRRIATRYDKLAKTFFAAVLLVSAFLIARIS